jgi:hypothetical protein
MQEKALQLGLVVYRVTKMFPEGEVLIGQMRQAANQVVAELILNHQREAVKQIKILLNYFQIARAQNWIKEINFVILNREYNQLLNEIKQSNRKKAVDFLKNEKIEELNQRQKEILAYVRDLDKLQMKDLIKRFPKLTDRTLRRDLDQLSLRGYLKRNGYGRGTFYKLNRTSITK